MVYGITTRSYVFDDKAAVREHFTKMTGLFKNLNYAAPRSNDEDRLKGEIESLDRSIPMIGSIQSAGDGAEETNAEAQ